MTEAAATKVSTEEHYARAIGASRLVVKPDAISAVDDLILMGWLRAGAVQRMRERRARRRNGEPEPTVAAAPAPALGSDELLRVAARVPENLAPLLFRLHVEWDNVKSEHALALKRQQELEEGMKPLVKEIARQMVAPNYNQEVVEQQTKVLKALEEEAERELLSLQKLMLSKLRTLAPARDALGSWATVQASKFPLQGLHRRATRAQVERAAREQGLSDAAVAILTGRVLKAFLDPLCRPCGGIGTRGGYGAPVIKCGACRGSGLVRESLGKTEAESRFAHFLLDSMQEMVLKVQGSMKALLHAEQLA
jgi:hypothetical protein